MFGGALGLLAGVIVGAVWTVRAYSLYGDRLAAEIATMAQGVAVFGYTGALLGATLLGTFPPGPRTVQCSDRGEAQ